MPVPSTRDTQLPCTLFLLGCSFSFFSFVLPLGLPIWRDVFALQLKCNAAVWRELTFVTATTLDPFEFSGASHEPPSARNLRRATFSSDLPHYAQGQLVAGIEGIHLEAVQM